MSKSARRSAALADIRERAILTGYQAGIRFLEGLASRPIAKVGEGELQLSGRLIDPKPLSGLERFRFEAALIKEVERLQRRAAWPLDRILPADAHVNHARLLKLGLPAVITDELLEESTERERVEVLCRLCQLNGYEHLAAFMDIDQLGTGHRLEGLAPMAASAISEIEGRR